MGGGHIGGGRVVVISLCFQVRRCVARRTPRAHPLANAEASRPYDADVKANSRSGEPDSSLSLLLSVRPIAAPLAVAADSGQLKDDVMLHISVAVKVVPLPFYRRTEKGKAKLRLLSVAAASGAAAAVTASNRG